MFKFVSIIGLLLIFSTETRAQKANENLYQANPFRNLTFLNGPVDTLTLTATYAGNFGELGDDNTCKLQSISKLHGTNIKRFKYAIALKLSNYPGEVYVPCKSGGTTDFLLTKQKTGTVLKIKCIVYRFFFIDGACNYFYVDNATPVDKVIYAAN